MGVPTGKRINNMAIFAGLLLILCGGISVYGNTVAIRGAEIHTMDGKIWESGMILIEGTKIVAISENIPVPENAEIIEATGFILYPGFIASSGLFAPEGLRNFESFTPDASAVDRFDFHGDYIRFLRGGVTTAFVSMPANRIIPGKGAVIKLGSRGKPSLLLKKDAALTINLKKEAFLPPMTDVFPAPVSVENPLVPSYRQFPSSNLGAFWLLSELFGPDPFSGDLARYYQNAANSLKTSQDRGLSLIVRCCGTVDFRQAVLFAESTGMPLIVQGSADAHEWIDILEKNDIPVIAEADVGLNRQRISEDSRENRNLQNRIKNISALIRRGLLVSIVPMNEDGLPDLFWITQYFQKYGINTEELIETITINPARIFGLEDRIGSLAAGKDADILFFYKEAGAPLPRIKKVMSQGQIVYEEE